MERINDRVRACEKCEHSRKFLRPVPGWGGTSPKILVIGQHPGRGEEVIGKIMSKHAGEFIRDQFYHLGLSDKDIYWTNVVCCALPEGEVEIPDFQMNNCASFLEETIDALRPRLIVGLGNNVRKRLFAPKYMQEQKKQAKSLILTRFKVWDYRGYTVVIVSNPAGVLRKKSFEREHFQDDLDNDFEFLRKLLKEMKLCWMPLQDDPVYANNKVSFHLIHQCQRSVFNNVEIRIRFQLNREAQKHLSGGSDLSVTLEANYFCGTTSRCLNTQPSNVRAQIDERLPFESLRHPGICFIVRRPTSRKN